MDPKYVLIVESGKFRREVLMTEAPVVLGRGPTATVRLPDDYCSREHGKFEMRGDDLYVVDLESRNGIFVHGERLLDDQVLEDGDEVKMGRTELTVRRVAPDSPATVAKRQNLDESQTKDLGP